MAQFFTTYWENALLDYLFRGAAFTPPATLYVALFTVAPTQAGGGTEVAGGTYARVGLAANTANFTAASAGSLQNAVVIDWTTTLPAATIVGAGLYDAPTGGNLLAYGDFTTGNYVESAGAPFSIAANQATFFFQAAV